MIQMNLQNRNRLTHFEKFMVASWGWGRGWREEIVREFRMGMYTLPYLNWINTRTYCIVHGTLFSVMWQLEWESAGSQHMRPYP